ncbi:MAG: hypothetical protein COT43_03985 [Candidatus Marinimicrobia bacterium CG08_land_8_20_14_0_20_45_22]|nr:MAG: hypothetical protein COT43_03985 [Candidatus Marinimicrobia bacterium CG08_land_8_20_14_0_20_45_22]
MNNDFFAKLKLFWIKNRKLIITWLIIISGITLGLLFHVDKAVITVIALAFGVFSNAFAGLLGIIGLVPLLGPIIVKVLSLPFFWLMNAVGYYVSAMAIKKGYKQDVLSYRIVTVIFLIGFVLGFIIAKLIG